MLITIWMTTQCNLKCKYCYEKSMSLENNEYLEECIDDVILFLNKEEYRGSTISFHGGEPLLKFKLIKKIINSLDSNEFKYRLTTNGILLDSDIIELCNRNNIIVDVSIDGNFDTMKKNRGVSIDEFQKIIQNTKMYIKLNPATKIRMTVNKETIGDLHTDVNYILRLGVSNIHIEYDYFNEIVSNEIQQIIMREYTKIYEENSNFSIYPITEKLLKKGVCLGGASELSISTSGDLYPCTMSTGFEEMKIGTIYTGVKHELVNSKVINYNQMRIDKCEGCYLYSYCNCTRCKILNKVFNGSYDEPSINECIYNNLLIDFYAKVNKK